MHDDGSRACASLRGFGRPARSSLRPTDRLTLARSLPPPPMHRTQAAAILVPEASGVRCDSRWGDVEVLTCNRRIYFITYITKTVFNQERPPVDRHTFACLTSADTLMFMLHWLDGSVRRPARGGGETRLRRRPRSVRPLHAANLPVSQSPPGLPQDRTACMYGAGRSVGRPT